jgi:hypothetical protein
VIVIAAVIDTTYFGKPEVRIDCGDLRWHGRVFALPGGRLKPEDRESLRTASKTIGIAPKWCPVLHSAPSNNDIGGRRYLYTRTAAWLRIEPALGRIILKQVADYVEHPSRDSGYPPVTSLLWYLWPDQDSERYEFKLRSDGDAEQIRSIINDLKYTPDPDGPIAKLIRDLPPRD